MIVKKLDKVISEYAALLLEKGYLNRQNGISKKTFKKKIRETVKAKLHIARLADAPELAFRFVITVPQQIGGDTATFLFKFRLLPEINNLKLKAIGVKINGGPATILAVTDKKIPTAEKLYTQESGKEIGKLKKRERKLLEPAIGQKQKI